MLFMIILVFDAIFYQGENADGRAQSKLMPEQLPGYGYAYDYFNMHVYLKLQDLELLSTACKLIES